MRMEQHPAEENPSVPTLLPAVAPSDSAARPLQIEMPAADVQALVKRLSSRKENERRAAEEVLERMGQAGFEAVLNALRKEAEQQRKMQRAMYGFYAVMLLVIVLSVGAGVWRGIHTGSWKGTFDIFSYVGLFGSFGATAGVGALHNRSANLLAKWEDVRAVGPLLKVLDSQDKTAKKVAEETLIRLLPRFQASEAHLLTDDQLSILHHYVTKRNNVTLVREGILLLDRIGDTTGLETVQRVAQGKGWGKENEEIRILAHDCAESLKVRAEDKNRQTLLRAASAPDAPENVLLRPAQGAGNTDAETLLRPAAPERKN